MSYLISNAGVVSLSRPLCEILAEKHPDWLRRFSRHSGHTLFLEVPLSNVGKILRVRLEEWPVHRVFVRYGDVEMVFKDPREKWSLDKKRSTGISLEDTRRIAEMSIEWIEEALATDGAMPDPPEPVDPGFVERGICQRGHGPLKEWSGQLRCWTCGWPFK